MHAIFSDLLQFVRSLGPAYQNQLVSSILIILFLVFARQLLMRILNKRVDDIRIQYRWRKVSAYTGFFLTALLVGRIWFEGFDSLSTYLGLLSAGLAIALKDPVVNLAGWVFVLWRRPFQVGDRIQIGNYTGDVIDQRIFMFSLMEVGNWVDADQSTGRVIHIPNGMVFNSMLANYNAGFEYIWNEIAVLVTFESDWKKAKAILLEISQRHGERLSASAEERLRKAAQKYMIFYSKLTPTVYTSVRDCGVLLTIRYLCEPRRRRGTEQEIWEDILEEFSKSETIDFAYPTQRYYHNAQEGKPGTRPKDVTGDSPQE